GAQLLWSLAPTSAATPAEHAAARPSAWLGVTPAMGLSKKFAASHPAAAPTTAKGRSSLGIRVCVPTRREDAGAPGFVPCPEADSHGLGRARLTALTGCSRGGAWSTARGGASAGRAVVSVNDERGVVPLLPRQRGRPRDRLSTGAPRRGRLRVRDRQRAGAR